MRKIVIVIIAVVFLVAGLLITYFLKEEKNGLNEFQGQDLISYSVRDNHLVEPSLCVKGAQWEPFLEQKHIHRELWKRVTDIIPADLIAQIDTCVFSVGNESYVAYVQLAASNRESKWTINIDVRTMNDPLSFVTTIVHEFAHIITLNTEQIDYNEEEEDCPSRYIEDYGCCLPTSYINHFSNRFWKGINREWGLCKNKQEYYEKHQDLFVTAYAATKLTEDIAESFAGFVLSEKPLGTTIADKKIKFFYEFPELVKLRAAILSRISTCLNNNLKYVHTTN